METPTSPNSQHSETMRLVPHSGIQFISLGFNLETSPRFSRAFIGRKRIDERKPDGSVPIELLPGWNEDDPDSDPPFEPAGEDDDYTVSKEKAVGTFVDRWIPVPFLGVRPGFDDHGREILEAGPLNWVRAKISLAQPGEVQGITHHLIFAFDTEILERTAVGYIAPTPDDVRNEREYAFAHRFSDVSRFLRGTEGDAAAHGEALTWVDRWLSDIYLDVRARKLGRRLRDEEKKTVEHLAHYITLLGYLAAVVNRLPRIRLIDTYAEDRRAKPVSVDLVLDLGNSRTCGVLIETYPNDQQARLDNAMILGLRDLDAPQRLYREPFESHVELAQASFGPEHLARQTRVRSFFWPSPVRTGPEATRYRDRAEGNEASSGMSSPKRYLCDVAPVNQEWRFQPCDYDASGNPPAIDSAMRSLLNPAGDMRRQVAEEPKLYNQLGQSASYLSVMEKMAFQATYSRSSMFTFMLAEIIAQTLSMINNPQVRALRKDRDAPRELRRIILSLPTAMPIQEQRIMRSRAHAAVKLVWDLMKWTQSPPPGVKEQPRVNVSWDEATCTQLVYLYNEIVQKSGGYIEEFFDLTGRPRKRIDPEKAPTDKSALTEGPSLRIASVDIGGGTTDLMITTYYVDGGVSLTPIQNFREGFRIAGDEVLREIIQQGVLPPIEQALLASGVCDAHSVLASLFASNTANMSIQDQHTRRQIVLSVFEPAALAILKAAESADHESETRTSAVTLREILSRRAGASDARNENDGPETRRSLADNGCSFVLSERISRYIEDMAEARGASGFDLLSCSIPLDAACVRNAVSTVLTDVFDCVSEAINAMDCDVVILSGRPSRLPATIDLFVDKLAVSPDRVVPLSLYQVGKWYPFAAKTSFRIDDPKTATVVGSLLCVLSERQITSFRVDTRRFNMRSTAKFWGELDLSGRIKNDRVFFRWPNGDGKAAASETAVIEYWAQRKLGYRQLDLERWIATPLYRLKQKEGGSIERIAPPFDITLGRSQADDDVDFADRRFAENEALKEGLAIRDVQARNGGAAGGLTRMFTLQLETLPTEDGYWLDTGILTVA